MNVWILFSMIGDILICKFYVVKIVISSITHEQIVCNHLKKKTIIIKSGPFYNWGETFYTKG